MSFFLCVIGMVMIVEGTPYFVFPERIKPWLIKIIETPDATLRLIGLGVMVAGLVLVYIGRS
ncbi:MAG: DUF2065 domain-containing protein [Desulfobacteraceae bacterium]|jgi:uncharacterized protein YjeT (DUF2065 family)